MGFERIDFISNPKYFRGIYVWSGVWQNIGWGTIIYIAALSNVSPELVMAARVDGANRFHIIWACEYSYHFSDNYHSVYHELRKNTFQWGSRKFT